MNGFVFFSIEDAVIVSKKQLFAPSNVDKLSIGLIPCKNENEMKSELVKDLLPWN